MEEFELEDRLELAEQTIQNLENKAEMLKKQLTKE